MQGKQIMSVLWPAFLSACVLEMLVFGLVDPSDLGWVSQHAEISRQTIYALAFLAFWAVTTISSGLSVWLASTPADTAAGGAVTGTPASSQSPGVRQG